MIRRNLQLLIASTEATALIVLFFIALVFTFNWWKVQNSAITQAQLEAHTQVEDAATVISQRLNVLATQGNKLADQLSRGEIPYHTAEQQISKILLTNQQSTDHNNKILM